METELMPCPVCGSDSCNVPDSYEGIVNCHGPTCCYGVWTVEAHNTLARRAEIGRLVEDIVDGPNAEIHVRRLMDSYVVAADDERDDKIPWTGESPTLLDALRTLAKEVCGPWPLNRAGDPQGHHPR